MSVERSFDAAAINRIINDPAVYPWVAMPGQGELDLAATVANPRNILLMASGTGGGFVFMQHEPGIYEVHSNFLPWARGGYALRALRDALRWMFTRSDCMEVLSKVPQNNPAADLFARAGGGKLDFELAGMWSPADGSPAVDVRYYALRYPDWVIREAKWLGSRGQWFHERLETGKALAGIEAENHPEAPAHDAHVGAAVEMILNGQAPKGVILYNRWAAFAGYAKLALIQAEPLVIDIRDCLIRVQNGEDFEVLPCRPEPQSP